MMTGMVKRVIMLLNAVSMTDRATSPPASLENTFDELPPGQHAISMRPMKKTGPNPNSLASPRAITGNRTSCPNRATAMGQGRRKTLPKSSKRSVSPRSNISRVRIGNTIQIVFMIVQLFRTAKVQKSWAHSTQSGLTSEQYDHVHRSWSNISQYSPLRGEFCDTLRLCIYEPFLRVSIW